jgi:hypothetical protein
MPRCGAATGQPAPEPAQLGVRETELAIKPSDGLALIAPEIEGQPEEDVAQDAAVPGPHAPGQFAVCRRIIDGGEHHWGQSRRAPLQVPGRQRGNSALDEQDREEHEEHAAQEHEREPQDRGAGRAHPAQNAKNMLVPTPYFL